MSEVNQTPIGEIVKKCWGTTVCVAAGPHFQVHYLAILKGSYCSKHCHRSKANLFHLVTGHVHLRIYHPGKPVETVTLIGSQNRHMVAPGVFHRFVALADSRLIEVYESQHVHEDDIDRQDVGGMGDVI